MNRGIAVLQTAALPLGYARHYAQNDEAVEYFYRFRLVRYGAGNGI